MDQDVGAGGVRSRATDNTIMNEIMLRFRPIAPKPASGIPVVEELRDGFSGSKRRKRRYVRKDGGSRKEKKTSSCRSDETLSLMPDERATEKEMERKLDLNRAEPRVEAESWVTVVSVTDACTDENRWMNLEGDTCPGFVSDGEAHVVWSNAAFRRMVAGGSGEMEAASVMVRVAVSDSVVLPVLSPAFSCMVRMEYTWRHEMRSGAGKVSVVPCDVLKLSGGGHAWRLDLKAGLSLGWN